MFCKFNFGEKMQTTQVREKKFTGMETQEF
jgi:hypothetical protein